jgi:hypothetical protein
MVVTELFLPTSVDPELSLNVGREALLTSPFTCLRQRMAVTLTDAYTESPYMILRAKAYVYDHQYEPAMKTDVTRRCKSEFERFGIYQLWHGEPESGSHAKK